MVGEFLQLFYLDGEVSLHAMPRRVSIRQLECKLRALQTLAILEHYGTPRSSITGRYLVKLWLLLDYF